MAIGTDLLILGPVVFDNYSPPERMPFGGKQSMTVHKYVGGSRVIDTTGPDDMDLSWSGFFFDANAVGIARTIDALRIQGAPLPLSYAGLNYTVVIADAHFEIKRFPNWVEYSINCVVAFDGAQGDLNGFSASADDLVSADIAAAQATPRLPANVQSDVSAFAGAYAAAAPLSSAPSGLVSLAAAAGQTALDDVIAAIPGAGAALDAFAGTGVPAQIASALSGLAAAAQNQSALVNAQGLIGRALASLAQAGV
jgi:hypothetical protein